MTKNISCGLLMYRIKNCGPQFFLSHPGGPFFQNKDEGVWTIPKGIPDENEDHLECAKREFFEETGIKTEEEDFTDLGSVKQKGGKIVYCWAFEKDIGNDFEIHSNSFTKEWPPKSGTLQVFPETDKAEYFREKEALKKINIAQREFIERLLQKLKP